MAIGIQVGIEKIQKENYFKTIQYCWKAIKREKEKQEDNQKDYENQHKI